MPRSIETVQAPGVEVSPTEVEIVELRHDDRRGRALRTRFLFVVGIAVLAVLVAMTWAPSRSTWALDSPLPNILAPAPAP